MTGLPHFQLRDSEGRAHCIARLGDAPRDAAAFEPLGEWEARRFAQELDGDELLRLWSDGNPTACAAEPPTESELRAWADEELATPIARVSVWRERHALRAAGHANTVDQPWSDDIVDLRDLASLAPALHWVEIRVVDPDGKPVRDVGVTLCKSDGGRERARTDANGVARWNAVPDGAARVEFDDGDCFFEEHGT